MTEKSIIYHNIWCCAYRRRYDAKLKQDWKLYDSEHSTVLMCLGIANWSRFDTENKKFL